MKFMRFLILSSCFLLVSTSCGKTEIDPDNQVKFETKIGELMNKVSENNFTLNLTTNIISNGFKDKSYTLRYTDYSLEAPGISTFNIGKANNNIFRYTIDEETDGVNAGAPIVNSSTGIRYSSIYDYRPGLQNINASTFEKSLSTDKDENGYFTYNFDRDRTNDRELITVLFAQSSYSDLKPKELKIKEENNNLYFTAVGESYKQGEEVLTDTYKMSLENIGTTKNEAIFNYVESGGQAQNPLDKKFYNFISNYIGKTNYTVDLKASTNNDGLQSMNGGKWKFEDTATYYQYENNKYEPGGYIEYKGIVSTYVYSKEDKNKIEIRSVQKNSDSEVYTSIFGQMWTGFNAITYDYFAGYVDPMDQSGNSYIITSSQAISTLASLFGLNISYETYCDTCKLEINDYASSKFTLTFDLVNKNNNSQNVGKVIATFSDPGKTVIPGLTRLYNEGEDASNQDKATLKEVMELFKNGNYCLDVASDSGIATRIYIQNYVYTYVNSDPSNNYGYLKEKNGSIYEFSVDTTKKVVNVKEGTDYKDNFQIPGAGPVFNGDDDAGYISHLTDEKGNSLADIIYNYDNYEVDNDALNPYWKNKDITLATNFMRYLGAGSQYEAQKAGFRVSKGEDPYDTRITLDLYYTRTDSSTMMRTFLTFYNLGNASYDLIETYLNK